MPVEAFVSEMEKAQRFILRHDSAQKLASLLSWRTINALLDSNVPGPTRLPPRLQLVRNGKPIPGELWFRAFPQPRVDPAALTGFLRQGATLVIEAVNQTAAPLGRLCADLSHQLEAKIWMNAYLTFGTSGGFGVHFDEHDILVLQVHGTKRWRFYDEPEQLPLQELIAQHGMRNRANATPIAEETLDDGDLLFLPRGEWHSAVNLEAETPSVHLSVGIRPLRGIDLLQAMRQRAFENPLFRRDAPRFAGAAAMEEYERALKAAIADLLAPLSIAALRTSDRHSEASATVPAHGVASPHDRPASQTARFNLPTLTP